VERGESSPRSVPNHHKRGQELTALGKKGVRASQRAKSQRRGATFQSKKPKNPREKKKKNPPTKKNTHPPPPPRGGQVSLSVKEIEGGEKSASQLRKTQVDSGGSGKKITSDSCPTCCQTTPILFQSMENLKERTGNTQLLEGSLAGEPMKGGLGMYSTSRKAFQGKRIHAFPLFNARRRDLHVKCEGTHRGQADYGGNLWGKGVENYGLIDLPYPASRLRKKGNGEKKVARKGLKASRPTSFPRRVARGKGNHRRVCRGCRGRRTAIGPRRSSHESLTQKGKGIH